MYISIIDGILTFKTLNTYLCTECACHITSAKWAINVRCHCMAWTSFSYSTNISNRGETSIHDGDGAMWPGFVSTCSNDRSTCGSDISTCGNYIVIQTGNVSTYGFYWAYSDDRDCSQDFFLETTRSWVLFLRSLIPPNFQNCYHLHIFFLI